jgi:hypothetical protein
MKPRRVTSALAGSALLSMTAQVAIACCVYTAGGNISGVESAPCTGLCTLYVSCPDADTCPCAPLSTFGVKPPCPCTPYVANCHDYTGGAPGAGGCCTGGTYRSVSTTTIASSVCTAGPSCTIGSDPPGDPE